MPFLKQDLPYMREGWKKVSENLGLTLYVFRAGDSYHAVSNRAQGVGELVETIEPPSVAASSSAQHGLGLNEPAEYATPAGCGTKL